MYILFTIDDSGMNPLLFEERNFAEFRRIYIVLLEGHVTISVQVINWRIYFLPKKNRIKRLRSL